MIAQAADTREILGDFAHRISNRSLLFEKMPLAKTWGHPEGRFNDATRFNVLRASTNGADFLRAAADDSRRETEKAQRNGKDPVVHQYRARIAAELCQVEVDNASLAKLRVESGLDFLALLEKSNPGNCEAFVGKLGGRLLINMAGGVQENAGIALDRCCGLPFIPGSAIKGVSRHAALWEIRSCKDRAARREMLRAAMIAFGFVGQDLEQRTLKNGVVTNWAWAAGEDFSLISEILSEMDSPQDFKGLVTFLPATPADTESVRIVAEGLTPHTDAQTGKEAERLVPLTFPAVERGSRFSFAMVLNRRLPENAPRDLLSIARQWLENAVTGTGVGAKTSAGYGWFTVDSAAGEKILADAAELAAKQKAIAEEKRKEEEQLQAETARKEALSPLDLLTEEIAALDDQSFFEKAKAAAEDTLPPDEFRAFINVLKSSNKKDRRKQWKKKKPDLWASLQSAAAKTETTLD